MKPVSFTDEELDALASVLQFAGQQKTLDMRSREVPSDIKIFDTSIAGYNQQKR